MIYSNKYIKILKKTKKMKIKFAYVNYFSYFCKTKNMRYARNRN